MRIILILLIISVLISCNNSAKSEKYRRSDCIVEVKLNQPSKIKSESADFVALVDRSYRDFNKNNDFIIAAASYPNSYNDYRYLYFQLRANCSQKYKITHEFFKRMPAIDKYGGYELTKRKVEPSPLTIDHKSDEWID